MDPQRESRAPATIPGMMAKQPMVKRTYYVALDLYEDAMKRAEQDRRRNLSDVIREALEQYAYGEEVEK